MTAPTPARPAPPRFAGSVRIELRFWLRWLTFNAMSLFTQRRVKRESVFDRKTHFIMKLTVTPTATLIASVVVCLACLWIFTVVFAGWPRVWARELVVVGLFISPALAFVSVRDLWRSGWDARLLMAALLSAAGFAFWCAAIFLVIHPRTA